MKYLVYMNFQDSLISVAYKTPDGRVCDVVEGRNISLPSARALFVWKHRLCEDGWRRERAGAFLRVMASGCVLCSDGVIRFLD